MDPNPTTFPILSYVMSKLPLPGKRPNPEAEFDIEMPPIPAPVEKPPVFDLSERMPELTDPKVVAAMRSAVAEVSGARSALRALGERPDHEAVDRARVWLAEIEAGGRLDEIRLDVGEADNKEGESLVGGIEVGGRLDEIRLDVGEAESKESEQKTKMEKEKEAYKAVISLDEMHEAYEKMLNEAETKLTRIYEAAVAGHDLEEDAKEEAQEEANEEVLKVLEEAFEKKTQRIDLSRRQLRFLPEAFGRLRGLVVLNLSGNELQGIPDSIGGLESLEELYLSSNLLESLPDSIGMLLNLKMLDVSKNKLDTLPNTICHCRSLVELDASFNRLTYLPTNIGYELVNLVRLSVHLNKIRSLPTSVGEMRSLRFLDVHFNELRGLPSSIGKLTNLETLNLGSNFSDLKELPNSIGNLTSLREIDLNNNQIHALPDTFGRLESLVKLNLEENPLEIPPVEVVKEGVEAVKMFMSKRWLEILEEEERRSMLEVNEEGQTGWLTRSTSWLSNAVSNVSGYLGSPKAPADHYLDEQR